MLKRKALRKIVITTFSVVIILVICILPSKLNMKENYLNPKIDTIFVTNLGTNDIYLLGKNNYLTKTSIVLNEENLKDKIEKIIEYLTIDKSSKLPNGLKALIPTTARLKSVSIDGGIVTLDFSEALLNTSKDCERKIIESITYSLINIDGIEGVKILINAQPLVELPQTKEKISKVLNRNLGINKKYEIDSINNTTKITMYYLNKIDDTFYYVPVTKYLNDDRDKVKIIIDSLSSNYIYEQSLMSLMQEKTKLINYEIENDTMLLNFSSDIMFNDDIQEEVIYQVTQSVFDNYDLDKIVLQVNGKEIVEAERCCGIKK